MLNKKWQNSLNWQICHSCASGPTSQIHMDIFLLFESQFQLKIFTAQNFSRSLLPGLILYRKGPLFKIYSIPLLSQLQQAVHFKQYL